MFVKTLNSVASIGFVVGAGLAVFYPSLGWAQFSFLSLVTFAVTKGASERS